MLSRAAIRASVEATHARLGGPGDWVLALPGHYVAGLMVLARTVLGRHPGLAGPLRPARPARRRDDLPAAATCPWFRPSWRGPARSPACGPRWAISMPCCSAAVRRTEAGCWPGRGPIGIRLVTTYGMSETCGGCVYDGPPLDGVDGRAAPTNGQILIGGPMLFSGYRLRPELTAGQPGRRPAGTADRGRWDDGRLEVLGRLGRRGDHRRSQRRPCRRSSGWSGRGPARIGAEAVVVGVPDPEWGTRSWRSPTAPASWPICSSWSAASLPRVRRTPGSGRADQRLPRLASGKPDRRPSGPDHRGTDRMAAGG